MATYIALQSGTGKILLQSASPAGAILLQSDPPTPLGVPPAFRQMPPEVFPHRSHFYKGNVYTVFAPPPPFVLTPRAFSQPPPEIIPHRAHFFKGLVATVFAPRSFVPAPSTRGLQTREMWTLTIQIAMGAALALALVPAPAYPQAQPVPPTHAAHR